MARLSTTPESPVARTKPGLRHRPDRARGSSRGGQASRGGRGRVAYVLAASAFGACVGPSLADALSRSRPELASGPLTVLLVVGLALVVAVSSLVSSLALDVILTLSSRIAGLPHEMPAASAIVTRALWPVAAAALVCAGIVLGQGASAAFASPVTAGVVALGVILHVGLVFSGLRAASPSASCALATGIYAAAPTILIATSLLETAG